MSEILAFKMVGGLEVVAEVVDVLHDNSMLMEASKASGPISAYRVRRPHILQMMQGSGGSVGLAFVPWTLSNPTIERLDIPASAVLLTYSPSPMVEKQYVEQTSGIQIAKATPSRIST